MEKLSKIVKYRFDILWLFFYYQNNHFFRESYIEQIKSLQTICGTESDRQCTDRRRAAPLYWPFWKLPCKPSCLDSETLPRAIMRQVCPLPGGTFPAWQHSGRHTQGKGRKRQPHAAGKNSLVNLRISGLRHRLRSCQHSAEKIGRASCRERV